MCVLPLFEGPRQAGQADVELLKDIFLSGILTRIAETFNKKPKKFKTSIGFNRSVNLTNFLLNVLWIFDCVLQWKKNNSS